MNAQPIPIAPWMKRRARILHGVCTYIAKARANGMSSRRAMNRGRGRFNRSKLALQRRRHLCESGMRRLWGLWQRNPSPAAFVPIRKAPRHKKITPDQAWEWTRRIIVDRLPAVRLFRQLKAENPALNFSKATLHRALPGKALRELARLRSKLEKAERVALASLDTRKKGAA